MAVKEARPAPDALLAEAEKEGRGRLKIFLGAAPGVGKTYSMLEAARDRVARGVDVVVGIVETHGRAETERLLAGLEILPRHTIPYQGRQLPEMDLDGLITRHPRLALVDELAHTNVAGSRHPKRWQDVEELLNAGIDVFTTLNVQHLESLNDIVERISGVRVRETLPDKVLELADEIELIDLPPEELIERLRQGKVYVHGADRPRHPELLLQGQSDGIARARHACRSRPRRCPDDRAYAQPRHPRPVAANERLLVCVNELPVAKALVRAAKRMAERARIPWIAVSVCDAGIPRSLSESAKDAIAETLRLAESLGAEVVTLNTDAHVAREILDFARSRNVNRIVVGRPRPRRLAAFLVRETVADELIRTAEDFEVTLISADSGEARKAAIRGVSYAPEWNPRTYLWATFAVAVAAGASVLLNDIVPVESLSLLFLIAVLVIAIALRIMAIDLRQLRQFPRLQFLPHRADLFVRDRRQERSS